MNRLIPIVLRLAVSTYEAAGQPSEIATWVERASWGVETCASSDRVCPVMPEMTWFDSVTQTIAAALTPH